MSAPSDKHDTVPPPPDRSTVILLLGTMADTTWRMFVPIIGLMLLGLKVDTMIHSKPWATIIGLGLGVWLAAVLVRRQFKRVNKK